MVAGFEPPEGDPDSLDGAVTTLGHIHTDLTTQAGSVRGGFADALETWKAPRSADFKAAGAGVDHALTTGASLVAGAAGQLQDFAKTLRTARDDIADLKRQAERRLASVADTGAGDDPTDLMAQQHANTYVNQLREQADTLRRGVTKAAGAAGAWLDTATGNLVPNAEKLTPDQVAQRVHATSNIDGAVTALHAGNVSAADIWGALGDGGKTAGGVLRDFWDQWGGFKPPVGHDPASLALYGLGQAGFGAGSAISWMIKVKAGGFRPRAVSGRYLSPSDLTFWERLKAASGRFPGGQGLSRWQRLTGFDRDGNFGAKGWKGADFGRWSTAGKWVGRAGVVITAATSAWDEWQQDAQYPTDERAGRAVTKGAATAAGAWAGAEGGAWLGGAIGTAICPGVGTVIGGVVGGLIGGFVGSEAGAWVGDQLKDIGGKVGDVVGDGLDKAKDAVKKLKFW